MLLIQTNITQIENRNFYQNKDKNVHSYKVKGEKD